MTNRLGYGNVRSCCNIPLEETMSWISCITCTKIDCSNWVEDLRDGIILCTLINKIRPNTIAKINDKVDDVEFKKMDNVANFINACKKFGVSSQDCMTAIDLFRGTNLPQVLICIEALGRVCRKIKTFKGPYIGAKIAEKNIRDKNKETKRSVLTLMDATQQHVGKKNVVPDRVRHNVIKNSDEERKAYKEDIREVNTPCSGFEIKSFGSGVKKKKKKDDTDFEIDFNDIEKDVKNIPHFVDPRKKKRIEDRPLTDDEEDVIDFENEAKEHEGEESDLSDDEQPIPSDSDDEIEEKADVQSPENKHLSRQSMAYSIDEKVNVLLDLLDEYNKPQAIFALGKNNGDVDKAFTFLSDLTPSDVNTMMNKN